MQNFLGFAQPSGGSKKGGAYHSSGQSLLAALGAAGLVSISAGAARERWEMRQWIEGLVGPEYALPVIVAIAAIVALFVLLLLWRLFRGGGAASTYVAGGRNRKARLAVMDATAIDNYRRLVLVRRDDIEHLLLIGGSADVVVESNIRHGAARSVAEPIYDQPEEFYGQRAADPVPASLQPLPQPARRPAPARATPTPAPRQAPPRTEPKPSYAPPARPLAPTQQARTQSLDDAFDDDLLRELEVELDTGAPDPGRRAQPTLDDEMSRLLDELSPEKR